MSEEKRDLKEGKGEGGREESRERKTRQVKFLIFFEQDHDSYSKFRSQSMNLILSLIINDKEVSVHVCVCIF